ncbi:head GIN domain-containing protein [Flavobacterium sp.]|uniref:head GIN domain-containing protein n=1 Tax=Flavobacterium sp. TaxID=239 RepID=UPI00286A33D6|nr:head GIN domain-containing protein [Flavobacterium sp.]
MLHLKKIIQKSALLSVTVMLFAACQFNGVKGSGNVVTENRTVPNSFKSIKAEKGLDVVLEQSPETSITVIADDNLQKHIKTTVENGVLTITSDINNYINVESKKVVVKAPNIESIDVCCGVSFNAKNTIKGNTIALKSSSGSSMNIAIEVEKASCEASSGSDIKVYGKAMAMEAASSSGSTIDAEKLLSNEIIAGASSGSVIEIFPLVSLNADASSGGVINYHNVPKNINKKSSSGGSISKE